MSAEAPKWMLDAARELSALDDLDLGSGVEGWDFGEATLTWPEDDAPGWEVWNDGRTITFRHGCVSFESDLINGDLIGTARRLLAALAAFDIDP